MECYCYLRNVHEMTNGKTAFEKRYGRASEIYVKRFKSQEVLIEGQDEYLCTRNSETF